jgi:hypothetical protein
MALNKGKECRKKLILQTATNKLHSKSTKDQTTHKAPAKIQRDQRQRTRRDAPSHFRKNSFTRRASQ